MLSLHPSPRAQLRFGGCIINPRCFTVLIPFIIAARGFLATGAQIYVLVCSRWVFCRSCWFWREHWLTAALCFGSRLVRSFSIAASSLAAAHFTRDHLVPPLCVQLMGEKKKKLQMFTAECVKKKKEKMGWQQGWGHAKERRSRGKEREKKQSRYVNSGGCGTLRRPP